MKKFHANSVVCIISLLSIVQTIPGNCNDRPSQRKNSIFGLDYKGIDVIQDLSGTATMSLVRHKRAPVFGKLQHIFPNFGKKGTMKGMRDMFYSNMNHMAGIFSKFGGKRGLFGGKKLFRGKGKGNRQRRPMKGYGAPSPPNKPQQSYGPPKKPTQSYGAPKPPQQSYGAPKKPTKSQQPTKAFMKPQQSYGPPKKAQQTYGPPKKPQQTYGPPKKPQQTYGPPKKPQQSYGSPKKPQQMYGPPKKPQQSYGPPKKPQQMYGPPKTTKNNNISKRPQQTYGAPKKPQKSYGAPKSSLPQQSYGSPQGRMQTFMKPTNTQQSYGQRQNPQQTYGPNTESLSQFGAPKPSSIQLMTKEIPDTNNFQMMKSKGQEITKGQLMNMIKGLSSQSTKTGNSGVSSYSSIA